MNDLINDTAETIENGGAVAAEAVKKPAAAIGAKISQAGEAVRDAVTDGYEKLTDKAHDLEAGVEKKIHQFPMSSVLIAVGVGLVVGYLMRLETSSKSR